MSWSISLMIINKKHKDAIGRMVHALGAESYKLVAEKKLRELSVSNSLAIGLYNNCTLLSHPRIGFDFFDRKPSEIESSIVQCFPEDEIIISFIHEGAEVVAFSYIVKSKRERTFLMSEEEIHVDIGDQLTEETQVEDPSEMPYNLPIRFLGHSIDSTEVSSTTMKLYDIY